MIQTDFISNALEHIITPSINESEYWCKIGDVKIQLNYRDAVLAFFVYDGFKSDSGYGILYVHIRSNDATNPSSRGKFMKPRIEWLVANNGINISNFCLEVKDGITELWVKHTYYQSYHFVVLANSDMISNNASWVLYGNPTSGEKPTDGWTEYPSTVAKLLTPTT